MTGGSVRKAELSSRITELSLRKTALSLASNKVSFDKAKDFAMSNIELLSHGAGDVKKQLSGMGMQQEIVGVAVAGITLAVSASLAQLEKLGHARLDFDQELKAGNATFLIPTNKEYKNLKQLQVGIDSYVDLCKEHSDIFAYLSLTTNHVKQDLIGIDADLVSTLPFYKMSEKTSTPVSSNSLIEQHNQLISLFFKNRMDGFLKNIKNDFKNDHPFTDFFISAWQGDNFLNNYRGPRLIMMSLANLLWNLQHPTDPETGLELTLDEKIDLCKKAMNFIGDLLNIDKLPNIDNLDPSGNLGKFVRKIEFYVKGMVDAYELEQNKSLTLEYVVNYAHRAAIILNENIFYIIYRKENQSETLSSIVGDLNLLLGIDDDLLSVLSEFEIDHSLKNNTPTTMLDLLLVYCQLDTQQKKEFQQQLRESGISTRQSFADGLDDLNTLFLRPIYEAQKKELRSTEKEILKYDFFGYKLKEKARRRAFLQLLPLVGLAVNDNPVSIDTEQSRTASLRARVLGRRFLTSREQINKITEIAAQNTTFNKDAFIWDLSAYLFLNPITEDCLNQMCFKQYKIGQVTNLLKSIKNFINKYHSYLLKPEVKGFIFRCFNAISEKFEEVKELCARLQQQINPVKTNDRSLINQIRNMDESLSSEIASFMNEVKKNREKLTSEHFDATVKNEIMTLLGKINHKFGLICGGEDEQLKDFIERESVANVPSRAASIVSHADNRSDMSNAPTIASQPESRSETSELELGSSMPSIEDITKERSKLSALMLDCYQEMSLISQHGIKGKKLMSLHYKMIARESCGINALKLDAIELAQIVCAYRPSLFFQAEYACTRSSKALIKAIISSVDDDTLPLYDWLFGEDSLLEKASGLHTKNVIAEKLASAKESQVWPLTTEQFKNSSSTSVLNGFFIS